MSRVEALLSPTEALEQMHAARSAPWITKFYAVDEGATQIRELLTAEVTLKTAWDFAKSVPKEVKRRVARLSV